MRIAISGAAGTGKSTLVTELAKLYNCEFIPEGVREYLQNVKKVEHFRAMTPKETMGMQWYLLHTKMKKEDSTLDFIADRSTADNVAYALRWCARETLDIPPAELSRYIDMCRIHCMIYDFIFVLPTGVIELEDDGLRSKNLNYQYEMECLIQGILMKWSVPFNIIYGKTLEERIGQVQDTLHHLFR